MARAACWRSAAAPVVPGGSELRTLTLALAIGRLALFYGDGLITPAISVLAARGHECHRLFSIPPEQGGEMGTQVEI